MSKKAGKVPTLLWCGHSKKLPDPPPHITWCVWCAASVMTRKK